jgi:hypothetical protein
MPFISQKDLNAIGAIAFGVGVVDFFMEGKLSAPISRAIKKGASAAAAKAFLNPGQVPTMGAIGKEVGRAALRAAPRVAGTGLAIGRTIALRHPVLTAGAVVYYTYKNRDELADLVRQGYDVVSDLPLFEPGAPRQTFEEVFERRGPNPVLDVLTGRKRPKKRKSTYNLAVSKGMQALKKSTSYGKKGVLSTPKKAFGFVARTVSKLRKGKKVPSKGASGVVKRSIGKITVRKP